MTRSSVPEKTSAITARGAATRARIVEAASRLVTEHGVAGTRLDDVMVHSGTSKSQIYHYFSGRDELIYAVVEMQSEGVLQFQKRRLGQVSSLEDLRTWRDTIVEINRARRGAGGCPIGSLASELSDRSETARHALAESFARWESYLAGALERMQSEKKLSPAADIPQLATGIVTALQGGLLVAQTQQTTRPLEIALDMALEHVSRYALGGAVQENPTVLRRRAQRRSGD